MRGRLCSAGAAREPILSWAISLDRRGLLEVGRGTRASRRPGPGSGGGRPRPGGRGASSQAGSGWSASSGKLGPEHGVEDLLEVALGDRRDGRSGRRSPRPARSSGAGRRRCRAAGPGSRGWRARRPRPIAPPRPWNICMRDPRPPAGLHQVALRPVQRPGRLEEAALLVAVGVADHHLLDVAAELQVAAVDGQGEEPLHDRPRRSAAARRASNSGTMSSRLTPSAGRNSRASRASSRTSSRWAGSVVELMMYVLDRLGALLLEDAPRRSGTSGPPRWSRASKARWAGIKRPAPSSSRARQVEPLVGRQLGVVAGRRRPRGRSRRAPGRAGRCAGGGRASAGGRRRPRRAGSGRGRPRRPRPGRRRAAQVVGDRASGRRAAPAGRGRRPAAAGGSSSAQRGVERSGRSRGSGGAWRRSAGTWPGRARGRAGAGHSGEERGVLRERLAEGRSPGSTNRSEWLSRRQRSSTRSR